MAQIREVDFFAADFDAVAVAVNLGQLITSVAVLMHQPPVAHAEGAVQLPLRGAFFQTARREAQQQPQHERPSDDATECDATVQQYRVTGDAHRRSPYRSSLSSASRSDSTRLPLSRSLPSSSNTLGPLSLIVSSSTDGVPRSRSSLSRSSALGPSRSVSNSSKTPGPELPRILSSNTDGVPRSWSSLSRSSALGPSRARSDSSNSPPNADPSLSSSGGSSALRVASAAFDAMRWPVSLARDSRHRRRSSCRPSSQRRCRRHHRRRRSGTPAYNRRRLSSPRSCPTGLARWSRRQTPGPPPRRPRQYRQSRRGLSRQTHRHRRRRSDTGTCRRCCSSTRIR